MPAYRRSFISHAHADNALCDPYAAALSGLGAPHYYDRANPQIGHDIGEALEHELKQAQALIVLASPRSLASPWVKEEINIFFALMMKEPSSRIIIPVKITPCDLPARLEARWWVDAVGRDARDVVAELARALEDHTAPWPGAAPTPPPAAGYSRVVDWRNGMGDHTTITAAIEAARPGERILVRKGLYEGGLVIDKPLEIVGDGRPGDVEVRASGSRVISFSASQGRVASLTLRQTGGGNWYGVDIAAGRLELEDCDISSQSNACVAIHGGADPRLRHCRIHDGASVGVYVYEQGLGLVEDCDIVANALAGVAVKTGGAPTVRQCRIHDGKAGGVYVYEQGLGLVEDCDIVANALAGVEVTTGGAPTVRHCRIHDGASAGVYVYEQGLGLVEDCDIVANAKAGVVVRTGGAPTVRHCRINRNVGSGAYIHDKGGGVFEGNDMRENKQAWNISDDSAAGVTRRGNTE